MKAIKLQSGNKLHHYWFNQLIRTFHFIQPGPVLSTILNYCPIRWLLFHSPSWILVQSQAELPSWIIVQSEDCFPSAILNFWPIRDELPPRTPPPWHRTLTSTLLISPSQTYFQSSSQRFFFSSFSFSKHCSMFVFSVPWVLVICSILDDRFLIAEVRLEVRSVFPFSSASTTSCFRWCLIRHLEQISLRHRVSLQNSVRSFPCFEHLITWLEKKCIFYSVTGPRLAPLPSSNCL